MKPKELIINVAGLSNGKITFGYGKHECGKISDGVSLDVGSGPFVISWANFKLMYKTAERFRRKD
jgi:hypothetical protein